MNGFGKDTLSRHSFTYVLKEIVISNKTTRVPIELAMLYTYTGFGVL